MKKGQRRFRGILFVLIAAAAGGGATYVAMNSGVLQATQDSPIMRTGSGDIDQGIRHQGQDGTRTAGDIRVGITFGQYETDLKQREQEVTGRLKGGQSTLAVAEAAYQRSRIALDEIRHPAAYAYAQRAARLVPENGCYLTGAGELAGILGDHTTAKDYYEQALASDLKTYSEDHPIVAIRRNNLGLAWQQLGEYQRTIGYYEQALAVFEHSLGSTHPSARIVRENLAVARAGPGGTATAGHQQNP